MKTPPKEKVLPLENEPTASQASQDPSATQITMLNELQLLANGVISGEITSLALIGGNVDGNFQLHYSGSNIQGLHATSCKLSSILLDLIFGQSAKPSNSATPLLLPPHLQRN